MATMNVLNATGGTETIEKPMSVENNALLTSILAKLNASLAVTGTFFQATQPISAASLPLPTGAATAANQATANASLATIATAAADTTPSPVQARNPDYETVAASATDQIMGASGAAGDYISHVIIQPATTSPGNVIIKDGSTTILTFPGGASSVATLIPFMVPLGLSAATSWKITTGANVSAIGVGDFT